MTTDHTADWFGPEAASEEDLSPWLDDRRLPVPKTSSRVAVRGPVPVRLRPTTAAHEMRFRDGLLLFPFALATALSYLLCNIAALLAGPLETQLDLAPADLGLLASVLFLAMAAAQIPLGILLDRLGPRRLMSACLIISAAGCLLCSAGTSLGVLIVARSMIGLGIAVTYVSGLKAARLWLPAHRLGTINGVLMASAALGAIAATLPAQAIIDAIGWRLLFVTLAAVSFACALLTMILVPDMPRQSRTPDEHDEHDAAWPAGFLGGAFWKLAPLSAALLGSAWALQGFWAAPWLAEVEGLDKVPVAQRLFQMAVVLGAGSLALGWLSDRLRSHAVPMLAALSGMSILAQLSLAANWPLSSNIAWSLIALTGAATVLSFSVLLAELPDHISGRACTALNLLLLSAAFAAQYFFGVIVEGASAPSARPEAFATAFIGIAAVQAMALFWFLFPDTSFEWLARRLAPPAPRLLVAHGPAVPASPYAQAHLAWLQRIEGAHLQLESWRYAAICSSAVCIVLVSLVVPNT